MRTSEILNKAADLIEERGWGTGGDTWYFGDDEAPLCIEGGMMAAMGLVFGVGDESATDVLYACPAYNAVKDYLDLPEHATLYQWNDSWDVEYDGGTKDRRSKEEVITTLRTVAAIEAAREDVEELAQA